MAKSEAFPETFRILRGVLEKHRGRMIVVADSPTDYSIASPDMVDRSGRPLFVAAVQIKKSYVSFHLMPVYVDPTLRDPLSPALQKRMQGKACFNFVTIEPADARELSALTNKGIAGFKNLDLPWARPV
jgi:hypothetical protein